MDSEEPVRVIHDIELISIELTERGVGFIGRIRNSEMVKGLLFSSGPDLYGNRFSDDCLKDIHDQLAKRANEGLTQTSSLSEKDRTISGDFATFDNQFPDETGTVILPGAFGDAKKIMNSRIKMIFDYKWSDPFDAREKDPS
jgi:hypothetical protein